MLAVQYYFPQFKYKRGKESSFWIGSLQPTAESPEYRVTLVYRLGDIPKVWVESPVIRAGAPHRYPDGSLCLYYPKDCSWRSSCFLAETIIPWAAAWLAFYEIWLVTGIWYGVEAPHTGIAKER